MRISHRSNGRGRGVLPARVSLFSRDARAVSVSPKVRRMCVKDHYEVRLRRRRPVAPGFTARMEESSDCYAGLR